MAKKVAKKKKKVVARTVKKETVKPREESSEELKQKLENVALKNRVEDLEALLGDYKKFREIIDVEIGDPKPKDTKERRIYVGEVARLHQDILRKKLLYMIHSSHVLLEVPENTPAQDSALKGTIYALREIIRWGDLLVSEQQSYTTGENADKPEDSKK